MREKQSFRNREWVSYKNYGAPRAFEAMSLDFENEEIEGREQLSRIWLVFGKMVGCEVKKISTRHKPENEPLNKKCCKKSATSLRRCDR